MVSSSGSHDDGWSRSPRITVSGADAVGDDHPASTPHMRRNGRGHSQMRRTRPPELRRRHQPSLLTIRCVSLGLTLPS